MDFFVKWRSKFWAEMWDKLLIYFCFHHNSFIGAFQQHQYLFVGLHIWQKSKSQEDFDFLIPSPACFTSPLLLKGKLGEKNLSAQSFLSDPN